MGKLFGTDGIRGKANCYPMTSEIALQLAKALAKVLAKTVAKPKVAIGKDTRLSGYMFETALTSGFTAMGCDVILVGPLPTPAIAHLTKSMNADAGIVISASHNPSEDNGIKVFSGTGFKLDDAAEEEIESLILSSSIPSDHVSADKIGKAYRVDDARGRYVEFAKYTIKNKSLRGIKMVLDCANGAAYSVAPEIFQELGAEVVVLHNKPDGMNINDNCGATHTEVIQAAVKAHDAQIGVALDGDADRVMVADEKGNLIDGDQIIAMLAIKAQKEEKLKNNTVVATMMSNIGLVLAMKAKGINVVRTKVGDRYVIEEMKKNGYIIGGEQSGHIIDTRYGTTGDGIVTALQILAFMKQEARPLSELAAVMEKFPQTLINVEVKEKKPLEELPKVQAEINKAEDTLQDQGRVLVRYSGTQNMARVMVEGKDKAMIDRMAQDIVAAFKDEVGA